MLVRVCLVLKMLTTMWPRFSFSDLILFVPVVYAPEDCLKTSVFLKMRSKYKVSV